MKVKLLRAYPSKWGPGKVHSSLTYAINFVVAWCTDRPIHAEEFMGDPSEITCKRCMKKGPQ